MKFKITMEKIIDVDIPPEIIRDGAMREIALHKFCLYQKRYLSDSDFRVEIMEEKK